MKLNTILSLTALASIAHGQECPGYKASNIEETEFGLTADLTLAGQPCDIFGTDIEDLKLIVEYQTG
jgi:alpha-glucosidase